MKGLYLLLTSVSVIHYDEEKQLREERVVLATASRGIRVHVGNTEEETVITGAKDSRSGNMNSGTHILN